MKKNILYAFATLLLLLVAACSSNNTFTIDGTVANKRTMNLRVVYADDDRLNNVLTAARDGVFLFQGSAPQQGALLKVLDNDYRVLAYMYVRNGDKIKLFMDPDNRSALRVEGNEVNERWMKWLKANGNILATNSPAHINEAVAKYAKAHPDDILSSLLVLAYCDASADPDAVAAILETINPEARPSALVDTRLLVDSRMQTADREKLPVITYLSMGDTLATFRPGRYRRSLLAFTADNTGRNDSILKELRRVHNMPARDSIGLLDFWLDSDTMGWHRTMRADSIKWSAAWAAGSVAAPAVSRLAIPRLPYFIVADRAGRQLYRGSSLTAALKALKE